MRKKQLAIKLPVVDFELRIIVFMIRDWGFKSPIPFPKNTYPQFKITNWSFYHQLVISTISSLVDYVYDKLWHPGCVKCKLKLE